MGVFLLREEEGMAWEEDKRAKKEGLTSIHDTVQGGAYPRVDVRDLGSLGRWMRWETRRDPCA
jgi:hypothetical protein